MITRTIRRIIGITALVLWVLAIAPGLLLGDDLLIWQLDNWAMLVAPLLTLAYAVMLIIHIAKGKHWIVKIIEWATCFLVVFVCIVIFFSAQTWLYVKVWGSKDYVVYSKYRGAIDPDEYILYRRNGLLNKRMYPIGSCWRGQLKKAEFTFYETLNLIKKETETAAFDDDRVLSRDTIFYRLSDGKPYRQEQNDSLLALIKSGNHQ